MRFSFLVLPVLARRLIVKILHIPKSSPDEFDTAEITHFQKTCKNNWGKKAPPTLIVVHPVSCELASLTLPLPPKGGEA
jgi:hypothetical protein